jgi:importin subunit beta-1
VAAALGAIEVPTGQWLTLLPAIFANVSSPATSEGTKIASLETLGFMCDAIEDEMEKSVVDQILNTIISGMSADRPEGIKKAAVGALLNSIIFSAKNFEIEAERNAIFTALCSTAKATDLKVREGSFQCLASIAEEYYDHLGPYMAVLFPLTAEAISVDDHAVAKMALEFWSSVFNIEKDRVDSESSLGLAK